MAETVAGIFLVDKPAGPTSFAMVSRVRRLLAMKKVGHAGTLDPFATGLLIICAGRPATRLIPRFMEGEKEYLATLKLGVETTTQDPEGEVTAERPVDCYSPAMLESILASFRGEQLQRPPAFSAVKYRGKPLYHYARQGIMIEKEARSVTIHHLELLGTGVVEEAGDSLLRLRVVCSKGTYIRTLAADIGRELGCGAHLVSLRRTRSGPFHIDRSIRGADFDDPDNHGTIRNRMLSVTEVVNLLH